MGTRDLPDRQPQAVYLAEALIFPAEPCGVTDIGISSDLTKPRWVKDVRITCAHALLRKWCASLTIVFVIEPVVVRRAICILHFDDPMLLTDFRSVAAATTRRSWKTQKNMTSAAHFAASAMRLTKLKSTRSDDTVVCHAAVVTPVLDPAVDHQLLALAPLIPRAWALLEWV